MNLKELSKEYRDSADALYGRIKELKLRMNSGALSETDKLLLKRRIRLLEAMYCETSALAGHLLHYYERGYRRNARYTL